MKNFLFKVGASLLTAAIVANVTFLFQVNERLARLETKMEILAGQKNIAQTK